MTGFAFAFAKKDDLIFVEFFYYAVADDELKEDTDSFIINKSDLQNDTNLNNFYKLSLILTENPSKLLYKERSYLEKSISFPHQLCGWGIRCKKHCVEEEGEGFTDEYDYNFHFREYPSDQFDKFQKAKDKTYNKNSISRYKAVYEETFKAVYEERLYEERVYDIAYDNDYISYYKAIYEGTFDSGNYIDMYIVQEIDKIEKELFNIDVCVQKDIMLCNANILKEVLPEDIVGNIKSIIFM